MTADAHRARIGQGTERRPHVKRSCRFRGAVEATEWVIWAFRARKGVFPDRTGEHAGYGLAVAMARWASWPSAPRPGQLSGGAGGEAQPVYSQWLQRYASTEWSRPGPSPTKKTATPDTETVRGRVNDTASPQRKLESHPSERTRDSQKGVIPTEICRSLKNTYGGIDWLRCDAGSHPMSPIV